MERDKKNFLVNKVGHREKHCSLMACFITAIFLHYPASSYSSIYIYSGILSRVVMKIYHPSFVGVRSGTYTMEGFSENESEPSYIARLILRENRSQGCK